MILMLIRIFTKSSILTLHPHPSSVRSFIHVALRARLQEIRHSTGGMKFASSGAAASSSPAVRFDLTPRGVAEADEQHDEPDEDWDISAARQAPRMQTARANDDWHTWTCDRLRCHLRDLGLHSSGVKKMLIERLEGHYGGIAQLKAGCSTARLPPVPLGLEQPRIIGDVQKCGVCGASGHVGGDRQCPLTVPAARARPMPKRAAATRKLLRGAVCPGCAGGKCRKPSTRSMAARTTAARAQVRTQSAGAA